VRPRLPSASPVLTLSACWLGLMAVVALFAPFLAPYGYAEQNLLLRLQPPSFAGGPEGFLLGTDHLGRDVFSRVIYAIRISVIVAVIGALIGAVFGTALGFVAAHARGVVEEAIMGLVDVQAALPFLIVALLVIAFFGNNLVLFVALVGLYGWERYARLARALVIDAKTRGYAESARSAGLSPLRIYATHIAPNVAAAMMVQLTLNLPETILLEAGLSFLGLGIQPPLTSLGLMLNDSRPYIALYWWLPAVPGTVIFLTTLSMSLLGDALRDRLDVSLR
jgi:peptide/nickel transport system permease protein